MLSSSRIAALATALFLFFLVSCSCSSVKTSVHTEVEAIPIELDPDNPALRQIGSLTLVSAYELKSTDPRFGGLSGLALSADGRMLYAVSDRGYWLSAHMHHNAEGQLTALSAWEIAWLLTPEGSVVSGWLTDAEALTRDRDGSFIVSFEQVHRLWRYPPPPAAFRAPPQIIPTPKELDKAPNNGGIEGVAVLPDGRILIFTEEFENPDGSLKAWLIDKDQFFSLSYLPSDGFRPTDLTVLANGDVLVLERRVSWVSGWGGRIRRISAASLRAGALLKGEEIARLEPPLPVDNFEGIAVREDPEGGTFLYVISDDNYNRFQRTLLLQFRLSTTGGN